ncbi:MAG: hypothetical protein ACM3UV_04410 [Nocardioidaceae bacterium]
MAHAITIRHSTDDDGAAVRRLAALDDRPAPHGDALLAFVGAELRAALPVHVGTPVADPFHRTDHLVWMLRTWLLEEEA